MWRKFERKCLAQQLGTRPAAGSQSIPSCEMKSPTSFSGGGPDAMNGNRMRRAPIWRKRHGQLVCIVVGHTTVLTGMGFALEKLHWVPYFRLACQCLIISHDRTCWHMGSSSPKEQIGNHRFCDKSNWMTVKLQQFDTVVQNLWHSVEHPTANTAKSPQTDWPHTVWINVFFRVPSYWRIEGGRESCGWSHIRSSTFNQGGQGA